MGATTHGNYSQSYYPCGFAAFIRLTPAHQYRSPNCSQLGLFSTDSDSSCVFVRVLAEALRTRRSDIRPAQATFRSLLAILLSGLALREWPEVRKGLIWHPLKSTGYVRTNQAVDSWHWLAKGTAPIRTKASVMVRPFADCLTLARVGPPEKAGCGRSDLGVELPRAPKPAGQGTPARWATSTRDQSFIHSLGDERRCPPGQRRPTAASTGCEQALATHIATAKAPSERWTAPRKG